MPETGARAKGRLRVAFDHRIFVYQKYGGVSRYFARLAEHLPEFGIDAKIISPLYQSEHLQDMPKGLVWGRMVPNHPKAHRGAVMLGEALHRPLASLFGADIVHETYHHQRRIAPSRARMVTTVYDMVHELFPDAGMKEGVRHNLEPQLERSEKIICISESTKRDLLHFYPKVADRVEVILIGFDRGMNREASLPPHPRAYLLYVGMRWKRYKNFEGLLEAFSTSPPLQAAFDVICVGGGEFSAEERSLIAGAGVADKVFHRNADDRALQKLYRHASLFVYPSLYEGFGIPPLESMAADCPVVCMHASSMPEVCGDAAEYAFPDQPESLRAAIERVAFSPERAEALRVLGRERLKLFSWRECARQHSELYQNLV